MHIPSHNVKSCRACQKQETQPKYDSILSKLFMMTPQRVLCEHLMRYYTLKGKDKTSINLMCLTMIDPAISWFDTINYLLSQKLTVPNKGKGKKATYILT
jgi:hypothetical protein